MSESCYFTLPELQASFRLATDDATAARMTRIWVRAFGDRVVDDRVVELPDDYGLPRLGEPFDPDADTELEPIDQYFDEMNGPVGLALIRFSDLTLTLLAGASPGVRARFERMDVPFAHATIDRAAEWWQLLAFLRRP